MCGIVGYVGKRDAVPILFEGLHRLEYRGYDSAGVAIVKPGGLRIHKAEGKVRPLEAASPKRLKGGIGIGHTRWATHGPPSDLNAHPHTDATGRIAVVHNGIVENAAALRAHLTAGGTEFRSETDTEIIAHMIAASDAPTLEGAVSEALRAIEGAYGLAVVAADEPGKIVVARNGSPIILGIGDKEMFVASDAAALVRHTQQVVYLDDGEVAVLEATGYRTATLDAVGTTKTATIIDLQADSYDKGAFDHFMRKEIDEQPDAVTRALSGRLDERFQSAHFGGLNFEPRPLLEVRRIKILGCGSAYISGLAGAHLIERLARIPASAEPASEFRYRNPVIETDTLYIVVSQSGETFDSLAALQEVKRKGGRVWGVVNVVGSTIARECDGGVYLHAGPEVAVVATKTFTQTLVSFALLGLYFGRIRDLSPAAGGRLIAALKRLPEQIREIIDQEPAIAEVARKYAGITNAFFIGRAAGFPVALEGALKLKEVSYIHAEAYPASELKHGPLALIAPETPTFVVLPRDELFEKNIAAIEEIKARHGPVIALTHAGDLPVTVDDRITVPQSEPELDPILMSVPLQLLAFHAALALDRDIDQPRNLAKSVTVE
jgi:glucosamine--fructose-6-phosphate aminotransferase (isomerizing)